MDTLQVSAQNQLRQLIEQIERLEEEKKALAGDIRDKYAEAKAVGFDVKVMRKIVSLRKKSKTDRQEEEAILATYLHALGMKRGDARAASDGCRRVGRPLLPGARHDLALVEHFAGDRVAVVESRKIDGLALELLRPHQVGRLQTRP